MARLSKATRVRRHREDFGNQVPLERRLLAIFISISALLCGYEVLLRDEVSFGYRTKAIARLWAKDETITVVLHGWPVFCFFILFVLIALLSFTYVLDHYDRRFNEGFYDRLRGVMLVIIALTALSAVCLSYQDIWAA